MIDDGGQQLARRGRARRWAGRTAMVRSSASSAATRHSAKPASWPSTCSSRPATPGRGQKLGNVLPRPGALAEGHEGLGVQRGGTVEIERAQAAQMAKSVGHSIDRTARAVRQGDADAAQSRAGAAGPPRHCARARHRRPRRPASRASATGSGSRLLDDRVDAGGQKIVRQRLGAGADDEARPAAQTRTARSRRRRHERRGIALADGAEPVAEAAVDGGDHQPAARCGLGEQDRRRGDAGQRHAQPDRQIRARRRGRHARR